MKLSILLAKSFLRVLSFYLFNIFIIRTGKVGIVANTPGQNEPNTQDSSGQGFTFAQVQFTPDGNHLVYVAFDAGGGGFMPRRLGLVHCINRRSWVFCSKVEKLLNTLSDASTSQSMPQACDSDCICITNNCWVAVSPRFSKEGSKPKLAYLACPQMDTHSGNMALHIANWDSENVQEITSCILVDQCTLPALEGPKVLGLGFPGLFCSQLPVRCFSPDGKYMYVNTQWGSATKIVKISTDQGSISCVQCTRSDTASENILFMTEGGDAIVSGGRGRPASFGDPDERPGDVFRTQSAVCHGGRSPG